MVERGRRWEVVRSPSYLRFALPGLVLVLPLPTTPNDQKVRADTRPGNWTGAR
jgi:regulator of protease activity HflC (stomatin/prohibitin superfamily)